MAHKIVLILAWISLGQCLGDLPSKMLTPGQFSKEPKKVETLSMEEHKKIYSYTRNTKAFKDFSFEETVDFMNELFNWEAPQEIQDNFGYSLLGYDFERRPVWYDGIGKQDIRWVVENGTYPILEKHYLKSMIHVIQSLVAADTPDDEVREVVIIWDMNGFNMRQLSHIPTVASLLRMARKYSDLPLEFVGQAFLINANYATKLAADIARPIMGNMLQKVEVHASNRNIWLPRLLKVFPIEIVPSWMGGKPETKPMRTYGGYKI